MELGEGDLGTVLKAKHASDSSTTSETAISTLDITFVRYWWKEMLQCVAAVHEKDIVHSDLKPANFLVVKGALKLIDFGIAGAIDIDNTVNMHRDSHVGTPNFMSPESLQDSSMTSQPPPAGQIGVGKLMKLGKPSDVWSLGCILYQMVYGQPPFGHIPQSMPKVLAIINPNVLISFPSTGIGGSSVPSELRQTLKKCLQRDPSKRPTVEELLDPYDMWLHPEAAKELVNKSEDLRIPEEMLNKIIWKIAERFREEGKPIPNNTEIDQWAPIFYNRIRVMSE
jgi:serine/threonine-protein kinase TTK/MPS1